MKNVIFAAAVGLATVPSLVWGQNDPDDQVAALFEAMQMPKLIGVMRQEGLDYGDSLAADLFPGGGSAQWDDTVSQIYDAETLLSQVEGRFAQSLDGADVTGILAFFTSDLGAEVINLELSAREALLDPEIEQASEDAAAIAMMDQDPRYLLTQEFVAANDLIEQNVVGAMNSSYAFYLGLMDGGVRPAGMTLETALQDVWTQEPDIRANTTEWVYSFLLLAYQPLSDDDLQAYIEFSESDAGRQLNAALFKAFDETFNEISRAMGLAASRFMISQEL